MRVCNKDNEVVKDEYLINGESVKFEYMFKTKYGVNQFLKLIEYFNNNWFYVTHKDLRVEVIISNKAIKDRHSIIECLSIVNKNVENEKNDKQKMINKIKNGLFYSDFDPSINGILEDLWDLEKVKEFIKDIKEIFHSYDEMKIKNLESRIEKLEQMLIK